MSCTQTRPQTEVRKPCPHIPCQTCIYRVQRSQPHMHIYVHIPANAFTHVHVPKAYTYTPYTWTFNQTHIPCSQTCTHTCTEFTDVEWCASRVLPWRPCSGEDNSRIQQWLGCRDTVWFLLPISDGAKGRRRGAPVKEKGESEYWQPIRMRACVAHQLQSGKCEMNSSCTLNACRSKHKDSPWPGPGSELRGTVRSWIWSGRVRILNSDVQSESGWLPSSAGNSLTRVSSFARGARPHFLLCLLWSSELTSLRPLRPEEKLGWNKVLKKTVDTWEHSGPGSHWQEGF